MATEEALQKPSGAGKASSRWKLVVDPVGLAITIIVVVAIGGAAWWGRRAERISLRSRRVAEVRAATELMLHSAESMLATDELPALQHLVTRVTEKHRLAACRIVLPDGEVLADADPTRITVRTLPPKWPGGSVGPAEESVTADKISIRSRLHVPGRGPAHLEASASIGRPICCTSAGRAGFGVIAIVALAGLLLVYRWMRSRLRAMAAIRESLAAFGGGKATTATMAVGNGLGPEAGAWNRLLHDSQQLRQQVSLERARESLETRGQTTADLSAACDTLSQGMVFVDAQGCATFVNGAASVFLQSPREQILGADIGEFIHDESLLASIRAMVTGPVSERRTVEVEQQDASGDGVLRYSVRPVRGQDSAAAVIVIEDVTQQRVAEGARSVFVAQATHELRTPLTNIRLNVETAIDDGQRDPALRANCLNVINQESRRLERMVGDILSVSQIEAGSFKITKDDVRLKVLFDEIQADYKAQAQERHVGITFSLPPKLPTIQADRDKIVLSLHNLIANALKYTPAGGQVAVHVDASASELVVAVADTGIGIPQDDLDRIFERFYRSKDPRVLKTAGSGLGLALAREVIRLHGGEITVHSEIDKGSTFTLTLPIVREAAPHEHTAAAAGRGNGSEA